MEESFQTGGGEKRLDIKMQSVNVNLHGRLLLVKSMNGLSYQAIQ